MSHVTCEIKNIGNGYEGRVSLNGGETFRLTKMTDKSTTFTNKATVISAARAFAKRHNLEVVIASSEESSPKKTKKKLVNNS